MTTRPEQLFGLFEEWGISARTYRHPALFTVEESQRFWASQGGKPPGGHCKNLFLKDKKGKRSITRRKRYDVVYSVTGVWWKHSLLKAFQSPSGDSVVVLGSAYNGGMRGGSTTVSPWAVLNWAGGELNQLD